ncbi:hypothetical protein R1sor_005989 [Riccia sorocarpa]|uniref:Uncharacterized protein n=1 Tax=Riccia sorocarpa TaxID=122646 RepID=A0ABD3HLR7_9MARC
MLRCTWQERNKKTYTNTRVDLPITVVLKWAAESAEAQEWKAGGDSKTGRTLKRAREQINTARARAGASQANSEARDTRCSYDEEERETAETPESANDTGISIPSQQDRNSDTPEHNESDHLLGSHPSLDNYGHSSAASGAPITRTARTEPDVGAHDDSRSYGGNPPRPAFPDTIPIVCQLGINRSGKAGEVSPLGLRTSVCGISTPWKLK